MDAADSSISWPSVEKSLYDKVTTVLEKIFKPSPRSRQVKRCRGRNHRDQTRRAAFYNTAPALRRPQLSAQLSAVAGRYNRTMADVAINGLLGGLSASVFLRKHWQKKPLLLRQAVGGFQGLLSRAELFALAGRDDVESRLVSRARGRWTLAQGPFRAADLKSLPARDWTLLVQGVNLHVAAADALLRRFAFIPYARLDDVMVSYAVPGGGVGPHVDSYDVFLLQGEGRRRWRVAPHEASERVSRRRLRPAMRDPLQQSEILARFRADAQCVLDPGDMLYLPPGY